MRQAIQKKKSKKAVAAKTGFDKQSPGKEGPVTCSKKNSIKVKEFFFHVSLRSELSGHDSTRRCDNVVRTKIPCDIVAIFFMATSSWQMLRGLSGTVDMGIRSMLPHTPSVSPHTRMLLHPLPRVYTVAALKCFCTPFPPGFCCTPTVFLSAPLSVSLRCLPRVLPILGVSKFILCTVCSILWVPNN